AFGRARQRRIRVCATSSVWRDSHSPGIDDAGSIDANALALAQINARVNPVLSQFDINRAINETRFVNRAPFYLNPINLVWTQKDDVARLIVRVVLVNRLRIVCRRSVQAHDEASLHETQNCAANGSSISK